tara:strand:+ start:1127 stop:1774 length:648 start_codon:yes stop_codon:yes gene_type:complete
MSPEPLGVVLTTHARSRTAAAIVRFLTSRSVRVLVTVANATANSSTFVGATTWHLPYNNFDSTGLMAVYKAHEKAREAVGDAFFYLHDTVNVDDTFVRRLSRTEPRLCALTHYPSMNMGVYTVEAVHRHGKQLYADRSRPFPSSPKYIQIIKEQAVRQEDAVFRAARCECFLCPPPVVTDGTENVRRRERFAEWGLVKMKANWKWPTGGGHWVVR